MIAGHAIHLYILHLIHNHHKTRHKKEYKRIQNWFLMALLFDVSGIAWWSIGFIQRSGYIFIRTGETYTAFKLIAVTMSFRVVQDFTFLGEEDKLYDQPGVMLDKMGRATLPKTAMLSVIAETSHPQAQIHQG
jgi:hypothetical protein